MKRIIALMVVVIVVVGGWTFGWFYLSGEVRRTIGTFATSTDPTVPTVACETLNIGGFPFRFDVTCGNATVVAEDLTLAARDALLQMIDWIVASKGLTREQAYALASVAVSMSMQNPI